MFLMKNIRKRRVHVQSLTLPSDAPTLAFEVPPSMQSREEATIASSEGYLRDLIPGLGDNLCMEPRHYSVNIAENFQKHIAMKRIKLVCV